MIRKSPASTPEDTEKNVSAQKIGTSLPEKRPDEAPSPVPATPAQQKPDEAPSPVPAPPAQEKPVEAPSPFPPPPAQEKPVESSDSVQPSPTRRTSAKKKTGKALGGSGTRPIPEEAEKVRHFWEITGMSDDEFRDLTCDACLKVTEGYEEFEGRVTEELVRQILSDYAESVKEKDEEHRCTFGCGGIVGRNLTAFFDRRECDGVLAAFAEDVSQFANDQELQLSVLLNFVRSVLRNDFVLPRHDDDLQGGWVSTRVIWRQACRHYFPENQVQ